MARTTKYTRKELNKVRFEAEMCRMNLPPEEPAIRETEDQEYLIIKKSDLLNLRDALFDYRKNPCPYYARRLCFETFDYFESYFFKKQPKQKKRKDNACLPL